MGEEGRKTFNVGTVLRGGLAAIQAEGKPIAYLVNNAEGDELWQMLEMVRDSTYLRGFLRAIMELPMENWWEQKLEIHRAFMEFNAEEIATLIKMYQETNHDSPVMATLNYDLYWTRLVKKEVKAEDWARARQMLARAKTGMANGHPIPGILSHASKKCLVKLDKYIKDATAKKHKLPAKKKVK